MMSVFRLLVIALTCVTYIDAAKATKVQKPNIVIILADDMGINDVSFHGSNQILTPNIDALAYNGVILNRMYVPNLCTPSRASLLTGKYPIHTGTQHSVIINDEPWGLPLTERLMPEIFHDAGYSTNLIGKWHLGFAKKAFTPKFRGFDYHVGYYSGFISYYDHELFMPGKNYSRGVDFRKNFDVNYAANGTYATDYFTDEAIEVVRRHNKKRPLFLVMSHLAVHTGNDDKPMEAPEEEIKKFSHISDPKRRVYAAMVSKLDESVGRLMRALSDKKILNNTIVLFYSDNGAPTEGIYSNAGSNYPFKGQKESPWEGGIRSAAAIWSPLIKQPRLVSHQLIHSIDWLPTLASAAGIKLPSNLQLDGIDLWNTLSNNAPLQSRRCLHVLDDVYGYTSYMRDNWKYVNGTEIFPNYARWLGDIENVQDPRADQYAELVLGSAVSQSIQNPNLSVPVIEAMRRELTYHCNVRDGIVPNSGIYKCDPKEVPCLFDIIEDPCEMYNIAADNPILVEELQADIEYYRQTAVSPANLPADPLCNPGLYNNTWTWWKDIQSKSNTRINLTTPLFNFTFVLSLMLSRS